MKTDLGPLPSAGASHRYTAFEKIFKAVDKAVIEKRELLTKIGNAEKALTDMRAELVKYD